MIDEPLKVSVRFRATVASSILRLERNAIRDEETLAFLTSHDHRRRQRLLVEGQIDQAFRLRNLLKRLEV